jgi:hypothetical protein
MATAASAQAGSQPRRSSRDRTPREEKFADSKHSSGAWSAYDLSRRGERHDRVWEELEEACHAEPELTTELETLFSRLRRSASDPTDSDPASELVGEMERTAATALHAALLECLSASGIDEQSSHVWSEEPAPIAFSVSACMPDMTLSGDDAACDDTVCDDAACSDATRNDVWGQLVIAPPSLKWIPPTVAETCMVCEMEWPLASFAGINDDADEAAACQLRLLQGADDGLLFGFKHLIDLVCFERSLRAAAMSARASMAAQTTPDTTTADATTFAATTAPTTTASPAAPPTAPTDAKRQKRSEEPRVQRGRELRLALEKVAKLYARDKVKLAKRAFKAIPEGKELGKRAVPGRADELRDLLFTFGGLSTTPAAMSLSRTEICDKISVSRLVFQGNRPYIAVKT